MSLICPVNSQSAFLHPAVLGILNFPRMGSGREDDLVLLFVVRSRPHSGNANHGTPPSDYVVDDRTSAVVVPRERRRARYFSSGSVGLSKTFAVGQQLRSLLFWALNFVHGAVSQHRTHRQGQSPRDGHDGDLRAVFGMSGLDPLVDGS